MLLFWSTALLGLLFGGMGFLVGRWLTQDQALRLWHESSEMELRALQRELRNAKRKSVPFAGAPDARISRIRFGRSP